jgi:hypothetical protein
MDSDDGDSFVAGAKITTTADGQGLLMTFKKGVYGFECTSANDCFWTKKDFELQVPRQNHIFLTVPSSLVEHCYCQPGEIWKNGICTACPPRHIPDDYQNNCKACNPDHIATGGKCESCPAGHIPVNAQNQCVACILPKISKAGHCTSCPLGQIPMNNQSICIETNSK